MDVLTPRSLDEALRVRAELPDALPIQGGTDLMVDLNFDRRRPEALLNLNEVAELKGWSRENGVVRLGAGLAYTDAMGAKLAALLPALAEASRTVGSPQIRNRGTIGGNLGTASPAGDALPPLLISECEVELASVRGERRLPLESFLVGPKRNALAADELIVAVRVRERPRRADLHEGRAAQRDGDRGRLARAGRRPRARRALGRLRLGGPRRRRSSPPRSTTSTPFPSRSPPRRARSTTCAAPPRTGATRCACS